MSSNIESKVQKQPLWEVYMVRTVSGKLYTGITIDLARRWDEHSGTARGAKFFRSDPPEAIVYREVLGSRAEASSREYAIKRMRRKDKLDLVHSYAKSL